MPQRKFITIGLGGPRTGFSLWAFTLVTNKSTDKSAGTLVGDKQIHSIGDKTSSPTLWLVINICHLIGDKHLSPPLVPGFEFVTHTPLAIFFEFVTHPTLAIFWICHTPPPGHLLYIYHFWSLWLFCGHLSHTPLSTWSLLVPLAMWTCAPLPIFWTFVTSGPFGYVVDICQPHPICNIVVAMC